MKSLKVIVSFLVSISIVIVFTTCAHAELYPKTFLVFALDYDNDIVTFTDMNSQEWTIYGTEDWMIDDMVAAIMDDNDTPYNIYDDTIITVYYQTNISNWTKPDEVWD